MQTLSIPRKQTSIFIYLLAAILIISLGMCGKPNYNPGVWTRASMIGYVSVDSPPHKQYIPAVKMPISVINISFDTLNKIINTYGIEKGGTEISGIKDLFNRQLQRISQYAFIDSIEIKSDITKQKY